MATAAQLDQVIARQICEHREFQGRRFQQGEFVGLLDGRVVATGKTFKEVDSIMLKAGIPHGQGMVFEVRKPETDFVRQSPDPEQYAENVATVNAAIQDFRNADRGRPAGALSRELRKGLGAACDK